MTNNISVNGFEELAEYFERSAAVSARAESTVNIDQLTLKTSKEILFEEAAAMVRSNGGVFVYSRSADEAVVYWRRVRIHASNAVISWFFRELIQIDGVVL